MVCDPDRVVLFKLEERRVDARGAADKTDYVKLIRRVVLGCMLFITVGDVSMVDHNSYTPTYRVEWAFGTSFVQL